MKHFISKQYLMMIALLFFACSDDDIVKLSSEPTAPALNTIFETSYQLSVENADQIWETVSWDEADYNAGFPVIYTLELSNDGFSTSTELAETIADSIDIMVSTLNSTLLSMGLSGEFAHNLDLRVVSRGDLPKIDTLYSTTESFIVEPYSFKVPYMTLWVIGTHNGTAFNDNDVIKSVNGDNIYEGYLYLVDSFKMTPAPVLEYEYGQDPDGMIGALISDNEVAIPVSEGAGYYRLNVDLNSLTYEMLKTDWVIVGTAIGEDISMEFNREERVWKAEGVMLTSGSFQFRGNDSDNLRFGDNQPDSILEAGGQAIPVTEEGNYTVILNLDTTPFYRYEIIRN
ncbi:SusE domain-containing protein [Limibacter armeniacum]|uniref:SusE domain-containing protein n=1 Tax=Limibacter armeniacum TaxID=466084 RepID=UPI002FE58A70